MSRILLLPVILPVLLLAACGGGGGGGSGDAGSGSSNNMPVTQTGVFIDSAVGGLHYSTATQSGSTNASGEFQYMAGETITFSIGDVAFPSIMAASQLTPFDLANTSNVNDTALINIARLLQTLDTDGNPANGISIDNAAHLSATGLNLNFTSGTFDTDVTNLINNSGSVNTMLIDGTTAINHLLAAAPFSNCAMTHASIGQTATLATLAHNVSGLATIVDDCTIRINNFNYDGGGLNNVLVYAAMGSDFGAGFAISGNLKGNTYSNATMTLTIPQGHTLDDLNAISVWCSDAQANFGSGTFSP